MLQALRFLLQVHILKSGLLVRQIARLLAATHLMRIPIRVLWPLVAHPILIVAESIILALVLLLQSPAYLAREALELNLDSHALSNRIRVVNCIGVFLPIAFALADHAWLERLEMP